MEDTKEFSSLFEPSSSSTSTSCILCSVPIAPTPVGMCSQCVTASRNIVQGISTEIAVEKCTKCGRYLGKSWVQCFEDTKNLPLFTSICMDKVEGLDELKVIDTVRVGPPDRLLKLVVEKEVHEWLFFRAKVIVKYVIKETICGDCKAKFVVPHNYITVKIIDKEMRVDIHFLREMAGNSIKKKKASMLKIDSSKDALSEIKVFFETKTAALEFISSIESRVICKKTHILQQTVVDEAKKKFKDVPAFTLTLLSVRENDLVMLPPKLQQDLNATLCLVLKVSSLVYLYDPIEAKVHAIDGSRYWQNKFLPFYDSSQLAEYIVIYVKSEYGRGKAKGPLANLALQPLADDNAKAKSFYVAPYLGKKLEVNDRVLGYELCSITNAAVENKKILDVIVVKLYEEGENNLKAGKESILPKKALNGTSKKIKRKKAKELPRRKRRHNGEFNEMNEQEAKNLFEDASQSEGEDSNAKQSNTFAAMISDSSNGEDNTDVCTNYLNLLFSHYLY
eukprot:TRINITY_DN2034_c0_g1_i4.p1 TRINITY_DN2034_c0_g1~~TRINITY_DN2034_c0_g1_i4.p1  ORF type:complete len:567 (-),score=85.48 TRINITY_DN2034_c0_g1_i4:13-1530(-)